MPWQIEVPALSASVLRGIYRRFVLLLDVEVRFDCAGSHKVSWRLLSASVLRGIYRRFVLLLDVEVRFDCAGSHKVSWRLLSASVLRGIYRRSVLLLPCPRELVSLSLGMLGWCFCAATASRWYSEQQHPKTATATATAPQSRTKEEAT